MINATVVANTVVLLILLSGSASGQPLDALDRDYEVVFDDFVYTDTTAYSLWSKRYDRQEPGSIFGPNEWWVGHGTYGARDWSNARIDRLWYRFGWQNHSLTETAGFLASTTAANDGVTLWIDPQHPKEWHQDPMIRTGFVRTGGVWAARIRLQDLSSLDYYAMQSFWTTAAFSAAYTAGGKLTSSEMDHEWNNWFIKGPDQTEILYDHTGYFAELPNAHQGVVIPTRARPTADAYSCQKMFAGTTVDQTLPHERCIEEFLTDASGQDRWIVLSIHYFEGERILYNIAGLTPGVSSVWAHAQVDADYPPTQAMSAAISQFIPNQSPIDVDERLEMTVDWFYYADEPGLSPRQIIDHVDDIRRMQIPRFRLTKPGQSYEPIAVEKWMISDLSCEDCARTAPSVELDPPPHGNGRYLWVARPTNRATRYRVYWKAIYHYADGYQDPDPGFALGTFTRATDPQDAPHRSAHGEPISVSVSVRVEDVVLNLTSDEDTDYYDLRR